DDNTRPAPVTTNDAGTSPHLATSHGKHRCSTKALRRLQEWLRDQRKRTRQGYRALAVRAGCHANDAPAGCLR
ncbi:hypothetical protein, partial [Streptomyces flaveolus]|uniref:hypothetical protein n=1 Tax=Streptomyces flaveolus TaxID=67297 RepID=UPI0037F1A855